MRIKNSKHREACAVNITYSIDPSVGSVPTGFEAAIQYVCHLYDSIFSNAISIKINIGLGDSLGMTLNGATGESGIIFDSDEGYSFSQVRQALIDHGVSDQMLPSVDPTGGQNFIVPKVQARALGLPGTAPSSGFDGNVIFSNTAAFDYSTVGPINPGKVSFVGVVEHEFTEVMGRLYTGPSGGSYNATILSLYRYSTPGVLALGTVVDSYFSTDRGATSLASFNNPYSTPGGDFADWAPSAGRDAFLANPIYGDVALSGTDIAVMKVLGYQTNTIGTGANFAGTGENDLFNRGTNGDISVLQLTATGTVGTTTVQTGGTLTLAAGVTGARFNGNSTSIVTGSGSGLTVQGVANVINVGTIATLVDNGNFDQITSLTGANVTITGSNDTLTAGNSNNVTLNGTGAVVVTGTNSVVAIGGSWTSAYSIGAESTVTVATAGHNNGITVGNNGTLIDNGTGNYEAVGTGSSVTINGSWDHLVYVGAGATITEGGNNNSVATGTIATVLTITGTGDIASVGANSTVTITGAWDDAYSVGAGSTVAENGNNNHVSVGNSGTVTIGGSGNRAATGTSSHVTMDGQFNTAYSVGAGSTVIENGNNNAAAVGNNGTVIITGTGDLAATGVASSVTMTATGTWNNAYSVGGSSTIYVAGTHNNVATGNASFVAEGGSSNSVTTGTGSVVVVSGTSDSTNAGAGSSVTDIGNSNTLAAAPFLLLTMPSTVGSVALGTAGQFFGDQISSFVSGDKIDITDLISNGGGFSMVFSASTLFVGGTLSVSDGSHAVGLTMLGSYSASGFHAAADGSGGTILTYG